MGKESFAEKMHRIEAGLRGVSNSSEIQKKMSECGYTPERMAKGMALVDKTKRLTSIQVEIYGDKFTATDILLKQESVVYSSYMITLKVVRVAFKGEFDMLARFKATGERRKSLSGWLMDARIFYENLLDTPAAIERLRQFGYTPERLQEELNAVNEIENLNSRRLTEKGLAQNSTVERDKAFDELCNWYSDFRAIARVALYDTPQLLEALGIVKK
jgi:hypothetical protein